VCVFFFKFNNTLTFQDYIVMLVTDKRNVSMELHLNEVMGENQSTWTRPCPSTTLTTTHIDCSGIERELRW